MLALVKNERNREYIRHPYIRATGALVALTALLIGGLTFWTPGRDVHFATYLVLHSFLETCSIVVCVMVFVAAQTVVGDRRNRNMVLLGVAFLGVALLDFLHTQSYFGMPAMVTPSSPDKAINFWLAARLLAAVALLAAAYLSWQQTVPARTLHRWTAVVLVGVACVSWVFLFRPQWMPETFVPGEGLTPFKIYVELVLVGLNLLAAVGFYRLITRSQPADAIGASFDPVALTAATVVTAMAELFFTVYTDVNGLFNVLGHLYKVIGAWFVCRGLVKSNMFEIETQARLALDAAELGPWTWDAATDTIEWNETTAAVWGLPSNARPSMAALDTLIHPDDRATKQAAVQRALDPDGDGNYSAEYRIVRADGTVRYVDIRAKAQFRDGSQYRLVGIVRDVSQRTLADRALQQSEARLSGLLSIAADAIISIDEQHRITLFNQGAEKIFGYRNHEVVGRPLDVLLPERFRASHASHIRQFAVSGTTARRMGERSVIAGLRKDGTEFPAEASISKLEIEGTRVFTVVLRDATERKQLEGQLERQVAERTAQLTALVDALPEGIVHADLERRLRTANAAMTGLFGYARDELEGTPANNLYASPADNEIIARAWQNWERGPPFVPANVECRRKDGSTFPAMVLGNIVRDGTGQVIARVGIFRDITDDLKRQKALTQAQRMEAFGQLTGGIAHDFNNLLTVISGNQELLEMRLSDKKDLALLKRSQEAADMGARLTARLLTFARRRQLEPTVLNLNDQILSLTELLKRSIGDDIQLKTLLAPRLSLVRVDASEIENAILNLAINARDAMPNGGTIIIETRELTIATTDVISDLQLAPGQYIRLSVSDTGMGMSQEIVRRAFEPFFTTKQPGKGTGLGLSTIHGFAQQSGGTATIYSEVGRGTTVNIYLPSVDEKGRAAKGDDAGAATPKAAGETVLLVEDHPDVRDVARQRLEFLGYKVIEVDNGQSAIERLEVDGAGIDLVFSDVVMPGGVSGYDLAAWIKAHTPAVKVLLTSGYPDQVAQAQGAPLTPVKLLRKPYSVAELARALRQVIEA